MPCVYVCVCACLCLIELPASSILELFGKMFFEFCQDSGYDKILQVLGATPRDFLQVSIVRLTSALLPLSCDWYLCTTARLCPPIVFLQNLDALHDHLGTLYPGMRAPSFRCTERTEDGALVLHYYSDRPGLEYIVIGIVKVMSKRYFLLRIERRRVCAGFTTNDWEAVFFSLHDFCRLSPANFTTPRWRWRYCKPKRSAITCSFWSPRKTTPANVKTIRPQKSRLYRKVIITIK